MMDLVVVMAPAVDEATMTKTFELIRPYLEVRALCLLHGSLWYFTSKLTKVCFVRPL